MSSAAAVIIVSLHDQFEKIIKHYKKKVIFSLDVIMVYSHGFLFNCRTVDQV